MLAANKGHADIVKELLRFGADINKKNNHQTTALLSASEWSFVNNPSNCFKCVQVLLSANGVDVDAMDDDGDTSLMISAHRGYTDIVALLLQHNPAVDMQGVLGPTAQEGRWRGFTALMYAAKCDHIDCVKILLATGANRDLQDANGKTGTDLATSENVKMQLIKL
ncbi:unnamed protein product [Sphagnum balticum]